MKQVLAIATTLALAFAVTPAFAQGNDSVVNNNSATVMNGVHVSANSGWNIADGGSGGSGNRGGDVNNANGGGTDDNTTGNGGRGGNGGNGGTVRSGSASAVSEIENYVNSNDTVINRCACDGEEEGAGNARVRNTNRASVGNLVGASANSGWNSASGWDGGNGGRGGDVNNSGQEEGGDTDDNTTGNGGNAGSAGNGGQVTSGAASSYSWVMNLVNSNVTRIRR